MWFRRTDPPERLTELNALRERLDTLERKEAVRAGEWADVLDRFERLYKRLVARQDRERRAVTGQAETVTTDEARSDSGESPLALRRRLRGVP